MLRSARPSLASLFVQELKAFVTGWDKLRLRSDRDYGVDGFAAKGLVKFLFNWTCSYMGMGQRRMGNRKPSRGFGIVSLHPNRMGS